MMTDVLIKNRSVLGSRHLVRKSSTDEMRVCRDQSGRVTSGLFMLVIWEESQRSSATDFPGADSMGARRLVTPDLRLAEPTVFAVNRRNQTNRTKPAFLPA